ncbi:MAG: DNA repair protein RecO [Ignavibacteria bacterium]|nr:DNA repair protein RecO [Ignavibacteria bacterium]
MLTKTDAIVLKGMKYRDTSKIVTFYTRRFGKLKGVAKGARQMKSKFGAALEPMTNVALVLYRKEHRDLQLVSQCDIIKPYKKIHSEFDRMTAAMSVLELVNQLTHDEEENAALYSLLLGTLDELERASRRFVNLVYAFQIRLAGLFGFEPSLDQCGSCGRRVDEFAGEGSAVFQLSKGAIVCPRCAPQQAQHAYEREFCRAPSSSRGRRSEQTKSNAKISVQTLRVLQRLFRAKLDSVSALEYSKATGNEIDATLRLYLRQHFEDLKPLKSLEIHNRMANRDSVA